MYNNIQVLIVGAGPTGLTLAAELTRHNIACRIIDKNIKPVQTSNALGIQARTLEIFADMGVLEQMFSLGIKVNIINVHSSNGSTIAQINLDQIHSKYQFVLVLAQQETERILLEHLSTKGIAVEMQKELIALEQKNDKSIVTLQSEDGQLEEATFDWIMACDGGKSIVRQQLDIPFEGKDLPEHFVMLDAKVDTSLMSDEIHIFLGKKGVFGILPYSKKYSRMIAEVTHDPQLKQEKSPTMTDFDRLVKERCGVRIQFTEAIWSSGFWIHERLVKQYQYQNIFFLGDAAHTHSPVGGQGMNTGIQDAYNLAWKFDLIVKNQMKDTVFTTYESERRPIAKIVLKASTLGTHFISLQNYFLVTLRNLIIKLIAKTKISKKLAAVVSDTAIQYHQSVIVHEGLPRKPGLKAGNKFMDVVWHGKSLFDCVQGTQHVILIFLPAHLDERVISEVKDIYLSLQNKRFVDLFKFIVIHRFLLPNDLTFANSIFDKEQTVTKQYGINFPALYVIRPDKYIGYRGTLSKAEFSKYINNIFV